MTTIDKIGLSITLTLLFCMCVLVPLAHNEGYRKAESAHNNPAYPLKNLEYVPPDHNMVMVDAKGYYWVEAIGVNPGDIKLQDCQKCHGDRWNRLGGWSSGQSLYFYKEDGSKLRENMTKRTYTP